MPRYVNFLRISEACQLLTKTSETVVKISEDVGFDNLRNFNRAFHEIMQMTPTEFRDKNAKKYKKERENEKDGILV
jgi:AraC-like DNA-binding protein